MHEAAHVVIAQHLGVRVQRVSIDPADLFPQTICDWEALRGTISDSSLGEKAFAIAYAGTALEMRVTGKDFEEVFDALPTDCKAVRYARKRLVEWQTVSSVAETKEISSAGFDLACSLVTDEMPRIERLADVLLVEQSLEEDEIREWFINDSTSHPA
jgi:hypothetical protein